jgi:hypothetical protein
MRFGTCSHPPWKIAILRQRVTKPEDGRRTEFVEQPVQVVEITGRQGTPAMLFPERVPGPVHDTINERQPDLIRGFVEFSSASERILRFRPTLGHRDVSNEGSSGSSRIDREAYLQR